MPGTRGWTPDEPSRAARPLLSCIDKAHTVSLVLEFPRDGEGFPAALLALIFVGWWPNSRSDGNAKRSNPNRHRGHHRVRGCIDHRDGVVNIIRYVGEASAGSDGAEIPGQRLCNDCSVFDARQLRRGARRRRGGTADVRDVGVSRRRARRGSSGPIGSSPGRSGAVRPRGWPPTSRHPSSAG